MNGVRVTAHAARRSVAVVAAGALVALAAVGPGAPASTASPAAARGVRLPAVGQRRPGAAPARTVEAANTAVTVSRRALRSGTPPGTVTLSSGPSGIPALIQVLGADSHHVLFAQVSQDHPEDGTDNVAGFLTVPAAGGAEQRTEMAGPGVVPEPAGPFVDTTAGSTHLYYTDEGEGFWVDLDAGTSGEARAAGYTWQTAVPGGGAWVQPAGGGRGALMTSTTDDPDGTPTRLAVLPAAVSGAAVAADAKGVLVTGHSTGVGYYSFGSHTVTILGTHALPAGGFRCTSVTANAAGCLSKGVAYRIPLDGRPATTFPAPGVDTVVVTPTATAWTSSAHLSLATGGHVTRAPFVVSAITGVGNDIAYARVGVGYEGVYRTAGSAVKSRLLTRGPVLPRSTSVIALTAGRVSWLDDSTAHYPVLSRRILATSPTPRTGPPVTTAPGTATLPPGEAGIDEPLSALAVSGRRSLVVGGGREVHGVFGGRVVLAGPAGTTVLATDGTGNLALSGSRAVWTARSGHVELRDLAARSTTDLTARYGISDQADSGYGSGNPNYTGALFGRYLAYERNRTVWRLDLVSGRAGALGRTGAASTADRPDLSDARTAGDWVAWTALVGTPSRPVLAVRYRNARTMSPTVEPPDLRGTSLVSVSPAGLVAADNLGDMVFHPWGSGSRRVLPRSQVAVEVDAGVLAWIGEDDYPRIAPAAFARARPQALGAPIATTSVRAGSRWVLDQVFSEALKSCSVVVRAPSGRVVARLGCDTAAAAQGEAVSGWRALVGGQRARPGVYSWQVVAADAAGGALSATGTPGTPVRGTFRVTR